MSGWIATSSELRDYVPFLRWLLLMSFVTLGLVGLWFYGPLPQMLATDVTHMSTVILLIFFVTALDCLYRTVEISRELVIGRRGRDAIMRQSEAAGGKPGSNLLNFGEIDPGIMRQHIDNLGKLSRAQGGGSFSQALLLRALADKLRSREKLGLFVSEGLLRLALLGTAIGFIVMLIPISQLRAFDADSLRSALAGMTGGMAIALNVTVTGIAGSLLLKLQYYMLDNAIAELFETIVETTEIYVVPVLKRTRHG